MKYFSNLPNTLKAFLAFFIILFTCSSCDLFSQWVIDPATVTKFADGAFIDPDGRLVITQFGITWQFDKEYTYGRFANGDYWVVGPVTIISIYPQSRNTSGRKINGSMLNPSPSLGSDQGYDSACEFLNYVPGLNVASGVSNSNPLILPNGSSLISTQSISAAGYRPQVYAAAILTVLASAPSSGSFRPPYCGTDKTIKYNISQLTSAKYTLLGRLTPVAGTPSLATVEAYFERPWIDHLSVWTCRYIHPLANMPDYGREMATEIGIGALMLQLDFTDSEKELLLIRYLQLGIDFYGIVQNGGGWEANGGHASGRKWPIIFAGIMLDDADMQNVGQKSGDYAYSGSYSPGNLPADYIFFGEDDQTFYVTADDVTRTNSGLWDPDLRGGAPEAYSSPGDIGLADWGIRHVIEPYRDNKAWNAVYRSVTAVCWGGFVLAARIMEAGSSAKTLWNHDALFDYQDRYMAVTAAGSLNPDWRTSVSGMSSIWATHTDIRQTDNFVINMWDTYRDDY